MKNNNVLIIGGTGTLGKALVPLLLEDMKKWPATSRLRIMSRGEHTQMRMAKELNSDRVDFMVGDVRDFQRVRRATSGCNTVFHFAAMKSVDKAEYDPEEAVKTNINGTQNVVNACIENGVKYALFTSTDKAVAPLNLYGATKLVAEKLFIQGNVGAHNCSFSVARYGNVLGSQGSVLEVWEKQISEGLIPTVTNPSMTRFFITKEQAAKFVFSCCSEMNGGEIFIPKMKAVSMADLCNEFSYLTSPESHIGYKTIGARPGEKMHEVLISDDEVDFVTEFDNYYVRWPSHKLFPFTVSGTPVDKPYCSYTSNSFTREEIEEMLCQYK